MIFPVEIKFGIILSNTLPNLMKPHIMLVLYYTIILLIVVTLLLDGRINFFIQVQYLCYVENRMWI